MKSKLIDCELWLAMNEDGDWVVVTDENEARERLDEDVGGYHIRIVKVTVRISPPRLNLVEGFFSKLARSVLRHIRVASKQELKDRIMAAMDEFNRYPVVHTWSYKLDQAA